MIPAPATAARWLAGLLLLFSFRLFADITLVQSDGSELVLAKPATRVVTLAPGLAEMVYASGAGDLLTATVDYSDYPEAARELPRIRDAFRFDLEQIMAMKPDLVLGWTTGNPAAALDRLASLGFTVWRIEMSAPGDIIDTLGMIAEAAGREPPPLANQLRGRLADLEARHESATPVRYFYQVAPRPLFTLSGSHIVSRGFALCGGENIFTGQAVIAPQVSVESVLQENPRVIFAPATGQSGDPLAQWQDWPGLAAVRSGALFTLPADEISRATPRFFDSLELACTLLDRIRNQ